MAIQTNTGRKMTQERATELMESQAVVFVWLGADLIGRMRIKEVKKDAVRAAYDSDRQDILWLWLSYVFESEPELVEFAIESIKNDMTKQINTICAHADLLKNMRSQLQKWENSPLRTLNK